MIRILFAPIILFFTLSLEAQIKFNGDPDYTPSDIDERIDRAFKVKKNNDFEFRFEATASPLSKPRITMIFLMTQRGRQWEARLFKFIESPERYEELKVNNTNLAALWDQLIAQNVLTVANTRSLKDKNGKPVILHPATDASSYRFSFVTRDAKRSYTYSNPNAASREYPDVKEFKEVENMINLISHYCRF